MGAYTVQREITLETIVCPGCTGMYAISENYRKEALKVGNFVHCWTCPYCKTERGYGEGEADKLRKQLDETASKLTAAKCETATERAARERAESELARHKTRAKNGVCPCCKRSFQNLRRHIVTKHPTFAKK